ncbi:MAG: hypothetical protein ABI661_03595, partial [Gammaproteobacteria bacterium]
MLASLLAAAYFVRQIGVALPLFQAIETRPLGSQTPLHFGVVYRTVSIPVQDGALDGRIVQAADPEAAALLIFHGNGKAVSDWAQVQARLY